MKGKLLSQIAITLLTILSISSCSPGQQRKDEIETNKPISEVVATLIPQTTFSLPVISSPTLITTTPNIKTATPTNVPFTGYSDLPDGEYILYNVDDSLSVISLNANIQKTLITMKMTDISISTDNVNVIIEPGIDKTPILINLETMQIEELPFLTGCYSVKLSPDQRFFLGDCIPGKRGFEVYLISRDGKQKVQLTNCARDRGECSGAQYSPDGNWLAYYWSPDGAIQSDKIGLYTLKTACLNFKTGINCEAKGPFMFGGEYVWSRNSEYMASTWGHGIAVFALLEGGGISKIREIPGPASPHYWDQMVWSVDSSQLALLKGNEIWLINAYGGKPQYLTSFDRDIWLIGWVKIKDGKVLP